MSFTLQEVRSHHFYARRILSYVFESVRENLNSFHQREKDRYDPGAITRVLLQATS